jgi:NADP-dependent aldehyde dehydrogenase
VHGTTAELELLDSVGRALALRSGRLIYNGWPTGVPVVPAMHHGGPWPATTMPRDTSVGGRALRRWLVPIAYQNWPGSLLPPELQTDNAWEPPRSTEPIGG